MAGGCKQFLSKLEVQQFTEKLVKGVTPDKEFSQEGFNRGWKKLDCYNKGFVEFE